MARKISVMFDELAKQYFFGPESFAAAIKLLQQYKDALAKYPTFELFQNNFLDQLDDVTSNDSFLLDKAIDYEKARKIVVGNYTPDSMPSASDINLWVLQAIKNQHRSHIQSISLSEACDQFISDHRVGWSVDGRNETHYRRDIFNLFQELVGDIKTGDLEKSHSILFKKLILKMPANRHKLEKYKNLTAQQLINFDIPVHDQLSTRSKQKYLQRLSGFLKWLQKNDFATANIEVPLQGVIKNDSIAHEERAKYSCDDLRRLFNSVDYIKGLHKTASRYWVPLIALFTGARLNEICQLYISDVYRDEETSIWVLDVNQNNKEATKKSIKRGEHSRLIPIHPQLQELGLLEYYEETKLEHERLFPDLTYHTSNKYGYLIQKWYNTTYTNRNNCNITTPNTSFHSLRHTLETYLANILEMPVHKIEVMMGQKPSGGVSTGRYIKPIDLRDRYDYIKKVSFDDCINFNDIRKWKQNIFART